MKKFFASMLALAAIAGFAPTASAQDEEPLIQFFVHGQPVKNGDRIDLTNYFDENKLVYEGDLTYIAEAVDDLYVHIDYYSNETTPPLTDNWEYGADPVIQFCWPVNCYMVNPGMTLDILDEVVAGEQKPLDLHVGINMGDEPEFKDIYVKCEFSIILQFDEEEVMLTFFIDKPDAAGVEGIDADSNAATVYYDLHGRQVANPSNGLYIVKQGSKATKAFIR